MQLPSDIRSSPFSEELELDRRHIWATFRSWMEIDNQKQLRSGRKGKRHWSLLERCLHVFAFGLKTAGLFERGHRNCYDIAFNSHTLVFDDLPTAFDGYSILHLTDLHFDSLPRIEHKIAAMIADHEFDLCVMTGDYRRAVHGGSGHIMPPMKTMLAALRARDGVVATLGNHDTVFMVEGLQALGIRVLANETITICRDDDELHVTGIDDVHYYFTDMVSEALEGAPRGFKLVLVHSPEIYDLASAAGYRLYLAGHTHGGQINLPGGKPVLVHCNPGRHLVQGLWQHDGMLGYTSTGASTSGIPIRFNSRGEITRFTLRRKA